MAAYNLEQLPATVNLTIFNGDAFSVGLVLGRNITDYAFEATIKSTTDIDFTITVNDITTGDITLSLTSEQAASIANLSKWYFKWTDADGKVITVLIGRITIESL